MNPTIRCMSVDDISSSMMLSLQNGWNTLPDDWRRQLALEPEGCFVADLDGHAVGTACACVFDDVAWVNLVLVDKVHRGRGIGTSLMRIVLAYLDERKVSSIRLDATPLGRPIYEKLGFVAEYDLTRFEGKMPPLPVDEDSNRAGITQESDLPLVSQLDRRVTGTRRDRLIQHLTRRSKVFAVRGPDAILGYAAFRPGWRAWQIGPCLGDGETCRELLAEISQHLRGDAVHLDIPFAHREANAFAALLGLTPQRQFTRMTLGVRVQEQLDQYWCSFGPEKG